LVQQASPRPATEKDQSIITYNKSRIETRAGGNKKASDHAGRPASGRLHKERKDSEKKPEHVRHRRVRRSAMNDVKFCKQWNQELQQLQEKLMLLSPPAPTTSDAEVFLLACFLVTESAKLCSTCKSRH
jgi:hypothetical protein